MAPFATVQRAQLRLLAHRHPEWQPAASAQRLGCSVNTVKRGRQRGQTTDSWPDAARAGTRGTFTPRQRAQIGALAGSAPHQHGKAWLRWAGEKLAQVGVEQQIVEAIAPGTSRRWLRADKLKPWRSPSWQHATAPQLIEKATPGLDLYPQAPGLQAQGELTSVLTRKPRFKRARGSRRPRRRPRAQ